MNDPIVNQSNDDHTLEILVEVHRKLCKKRLSHKDKSSCRLAVSQLVEAIGCGGTTGLELVQAAT